MTRVTHHEIPDGPVENGAIVILLLAELDKVFAGFWCLQNNPDTSMRHEAANGAFPMPLKPCPCSGKGLAARCDHNKDQAAQPESKGHREMPAEQQGEWWGVPGVCSPPRWA